VHILNAFPAEDANVISDIKVNWFVINYACVRRIPFDVAHGREITVRSQSLA